MMRPGAPMRLRNLQALRGAACLLVVFAHLSLVESRQPAPHLGRPLDFFAPGAIDILFVLSGFVITWANLGALGQPHRAAGYLARRLWRVYPVYWVCWLVVLPLAHGFVNADWLLRSPVIWSLWPDLVLWPRFQTNFAVPQAWTMLYEVTFYVIFAAFVLLPRHVFVPGLLFWAAVGVAAIVAPNIAARYAVDYGYVAAWVWRPSYLKIVLGCLLAVAVRRGWTGGGRAALVAGLAGFVAAAAMVYGLPGPTTLRFEPFLLPSVLLVYASVVVEIRRGWVLPSWLQITGDASFPIYLTHLGMLEFGHRNFGGAGTTVLGHLAWFLLMTAAALAIGFVMHLLVERPVLNMARRRPRPSATASVPLRRAA
jgi:peptidoglycan/LPS O-acetylase OafA/YrhL